MNLLVIYLVELLFIVLCSLAAFLSFLLGLGLLTFGVGLRRCCRVEERRHRTIPSIRVLSLACFWSECHEQPGM